MKYIILFLLLINFTLGYSLEYSNYEVSFLKHIQIGTGNNQLMYAAEMQPPQGPYSFNISPTNFVYVMDSLNGRLVVFDKNINFVKNIYYKFKNQDNRFMPSFIKFNIDEEIILYGHLYHYRNKKREKTSCLLKINQNGEEIFIVDNKQFSDEFNNYQINNDFYPINDYIFLHDLKRKVRCIDNNGTIYSTNQTIELINKLTKENLTKEYIESDKNFLKKIDQEVDLFINNKLLTSSFFYYRKYINFYDNRIDTSKNNKYIINWDEIKVVMTLIGYDNDSNSYWGDFFYKNKKAIVVISAQGYVVDIIETPNYPNTAIAPNGDVYFMDKNKEGVQFYKIERRW